MTVDAHQYEDVCIDRSVGWSLNKKFVSPFTIRLLFLDELRGEVKIRQVNESERIKD